MATLEEILAEIIGRLNRVEAQLDDLGSSVGETTSVDVVNTLPSNPYDGQVVLLTDGSGGLQNGTFQRYDDSISDWIQVTN